MKHQPGERQKDTGGNKQRSRHLSPGRLGLYALGATGILAATLYATNRSSAAGTESGLPTYDPGAGEKVASTTYYGEGWDHSKWETAVVEQAGDTANKAMVVLQLNNETNTWKVVEGPGTGLQPVDGAPRELNEALGEQNPPTPGQQGATDGG